MIKEYTTPIVSKEYITPDTIHFKLQKPESFTYLPGQFITIHVKREDTKRYKSYSIYNAPSKDTLDLCIRIVPNGFASTYFKHVEEGTRLTIKGPLGAFTVTEAQHHVFLGTGTGVAPLKAMIEHVLEETNNTAELIAGHKTREDIIYKEGFETMEGKRFSYTPTLSRETWQGKEGYVQQHIETKPGTAYYVCGLKDFVLDAETKLQSLGVPEDAIHKERFS
jgi:CDP-4-dehydro-6-deoxyglucose reductase